MILSGSSIFMTDTDRPRLLNNCGCRMFVKNNHVHS
ncbi:hypothetical protein H206_06263 [Candidatus Electrothrix aarhusensis]|uniref:Uncharacterized protein n=1 Tax=Candidatus Electrothrix aarhusensis TaxID=1859131 RepID=A0A444J383_9BACT|nr:hypothetical protein H206_06263 [Candidatus Electrothrix aarhusensis]